MIYLYNLSIALYTRLIAAAAFFGNPKARLWINGRKHLFEKISADLKAGERRIWIHAASLGEFEQGRPLIEKIKEQYPDRKIVLTFFSPSGYEVRKNYNGADYIYYLPSDTPRHARRFIDLIQPEKVLFIKYEFWYNYLSALKNRKIPVYLCSAIFRKDQIFFTWYGGWFREILTFFDHLFVQTEDSRKLLLSAGFHHVSVAGDTRFDRVFAIASQARQIPEVMSFVGNHRSFIAGSTWEPDEDLLSRYINETSLPLKYIIAPHEIQASHIERLEKSITKRVVRFSQWKQNQEKEDFDVLIIDNIGMLSSLYQYAQVAYIGGGFGKGIHNILEAATFGLPVLFGPNHGKFQEAVDLIKEGGAFPIDHYDHLKDKLDQFYDGSSLLEEAGRTAAQFVKRNTGATEKIISHLALG
jgi:3-deoxy-D-manno-octulosonic-acid transferase